MFSKNFFRALIVATLVVVYLSLGDNIPTIIKQNPPAIEYAYSSPVNTIEQVARIAVPAVVMITIKTDVCPFSFYNPQKPDKDGLYTSGTGSGVLYTPDGHIITNNHVIREAKKIIVTLSDGQVFEAKIIGARPKQDVAVLRIDGYNLPFLRFGNSNSLVIGQSIVVVGAPYGFQSTVTAGIISHTNRDVTDLPVNTGVVEVKSYIQVDAAINGGNSGGALVDLQGNLIGIVCASYSRSGGSEGLGFALHESLVRKTIRSITGQYIVN